MLSIFGFNKNKAQANIIAATHRIEIQSKKQSNSMSSSKKEIARLLRDKHYDLARIKASEVILASARHEAEQIVSMMLKMLASRVEQLAKLQTCPDDTVETAATVIWASSRMPGIPELSDVAKQLTAKFGKQFGNAAAAGTSDSINATVKSKLSGGLPDGNTTASLLKDIATEQGIDFVPERDLANSLIGLNKGSGAVTGTATSGGAHGTGGGGAITSSGTGGCVPVLPNQPVQNVVLKHPDGSTTTITIVPSQVPMQHAGQLNGGGAAAVSGGAAAEPCAGASAGVFFPPPATTDGPYPPPGSGGLQFFDPHSGLPIAAPHGAPQYPHQFPQQQHHGGNHYSAPLHEGHSLIAGVPLSSVALPPAASEQQSAMMQAQLAQAQAQVQAQQILLEQQQRQLASAASVPSGHPGSIPVALPVAPVVMPAGITGTGVPLATPLPASGVPPAGDGSCRTDDGYPVKPRKVLNPEADGDCSPTAAGGSAAGHGTDAAPPSTAAPAAYNDLVARFAALRGPAAAAGGSDEGPSSGAV